MAGDHVALVAAFEHQRAVEGVADRTIGGRQSGDAAETAAAGQGVLAGFAVMTGDRHLGIAGIGQFGFLDDAARSVRLAETGAALGVVSEGQITLTVVADPGQGVRIARAGVARLVVMVGPDVAVRVLHRLQITVGVVGILNRVSVRQLHRSQAESRIDELQLQPCGIGHGEQAFAVVAEGQLAAGAQVLDSQQSPGIAEVTDGIAAIAELEDVFAALHHQVDDFLRIFRRYEARRAADALVGLEISAVGDPREPGVVGRADNPLRIRMRPAGRQFGTLPGLLQGMVGAYERAAREFEIGLEPGLVAGRGKTGCAAFLSGHIGRHRALRPLSGRDLQIDRSGTNLIEFDRRRRRRIVGRMRAGSGHESGRALIRCEFVEQVIVAAGRRTGRVEKPDMQGRLQRRIVVVVVPQGTLHAAMRGGFRKRREVMLVDPVLDRTAMRGVLRGNDGLNHLPLIRTGIRAHRVAARRAELRRRAAGEAGRVNGRIGRGCGLVLNAEMQFQQLQTIGPFEKSGLFLDEEIRIIRIRGLHPADRVRPRPTVVAIAVLRFVRRHDLRLRPCRKEEQCDTVGRAESLNPTHR